jgi:hypothetical protein
MDSGYPTLGETLGVLRDVWVQYRLPLPGNRGYWPGQMNTLDDVYQVLVRSGVIDVAGREKCSGR